MVAKTCFVLNGEVCACVFMECDESTCDLDDLPENIPVDEIKNNLKQIYLVDPKESETSRNIILCYNLPNCYDI